MRGSRVRVTQAAPVLAKIDLPQLSRSRPVGRVREIPHPSSVDDSVFAREEVAAMTLEQIANANGKTLFEFFSETYRWRWGSPPLEGTIDEDLRRYQDLGKAPKHTEDYLRQFQATTPYLN
jgi:hypothetical protein